MPNLISHASRGNVAPRVALRRLAPGTSPHDSHQHAPNDRTSSSITQDGNGLRAVPARRRRRLWHRPGLEQLEARIALDASSNLTALKGAASALGSFAASLAAGPLNEDLPILSGGASALSQILGLNSSFGSLGTDLGQIDTTSVATAADPKAALQSELGSAFTVLEVSDTQVLVSYTQNITGGPTVSAATNLADFFGSNQAGDYLSKIASLSGSASVQFAPGRSSP